VKRAPVTSMLLAAIGIAFGFQLAMALRGGVIDALFFLTRPTAAQLIADGAITPDGEPWRLFTAPFLHAGIFHLLLNAWALLQLGTLFERLSGSAALLLVYGMSALGASMASLVFLSATCSVGASGAILGVAGALIATQRGDQVWSAALRAQLALYCGVTIVLGFFVPEIDKAAHAGGLITGLLIGAVLRFIPKPRQSVSRG